MANKLYEADAINIKVMYYAAFCFVFLIIVGVVFMTLVSIPHHQKPSFTFDNVTYNFTYVASNLTAWQEGLMNKTVGNNTFELFAFPTYAVYPFWMKNTYYPLDILWINGSRVVFVVHAVPCSWYSPYQSNCTIYNQYNSSTPGYGHVANYVIEAEGGFANSTGIAVGSVIYINPN